MNIKRAFLAAVAVLAMPGLAMAQSTHTFAVDAVISGGTGELDVALSCNTGFPQNQDGTTPLSFSVNSASDGFRCAILVDGELSPGFVISDYTTEDGSNGTGGCVWDPLNAATTTAHTCTITAEVTETDFNVTVDWDFTDIEEEGGADTDIGQAAEVIVQCENAWNGFTLTTISDSFPAGPDAQFPLALPVTPNPDTNGVPTVCNAGLDPLTVESAVAADEQECGSVVVTAGGMGACTIFATVFFEGIPTLSQYGMAIMALLMLGVGFVGFRRFV